MNILPHTSNIGPTRGASVGQASARLANRPDDALVERESVPVDSLERSDPELQVASYGKIIGEFGLFLGSLPVLAAGAAAGLAATLVVVGGMAAGPVLVGAGLLYGSLSTAALGVGVGTASYAANRGMEKVMDWVEKRTAGKASPPAKPSLPVPSDIPGAEMTREAVLSLASEKGSKAYERLATSYEHSAPIYGGYVRTYGKDYGGPTLGHMHAQAGREIRKQQAEAAEHLKRTHVGLGFGAALAGAAVLSGVGVVGVGLGGLSCLMLKGAYDVHQDRKSDLALAEAHASNQQLMEELGRGK